MKKVTLYSMQNCPYCVKAKQLLTQRKVDFNLIMIDDWSDAEWNALVKKSGMKTLPQIFAGDTLIGGYSQLADLDASDQLSSLKSE